MFLFRRKPLPGPHLPAPVQAYIAAPAPDPAAPWRTIPYSVIDVETSGLNARNDSLLSIGLVEIEGGRVQLETHWYSLIRPAAHDPVAGESIRVHGLMRAELALAPAPEEVLPELLARLRGRVLIVHVASVDIGFINAALGRLYRLQLRGPAIDTALLAATLHQNERFLGAPDAQMPSRQLRALAERAGLPVYPEHNALNDALTTAQLFLYQATRLEAHGNRTLRGLLRAGACLR